MEKGDNMHQPDRLFFLVEQVKLCTVYFVLFLRFKIYKNLKHFYINICVSRYL